MTATDLTTTVSIHHPSTPGREVLRHHLARFQRIIESRRGPAQRITARDICVILEIRDPTGVMVRSLANAAIDAGVPVGSSSGDGGGGYFLITTVDELAASTRHLESRAAAILDCVERLRDAFHHGPRQGALL